MASRARREGETYEQYKANLRAEARIQKLRDRGFRGNLVNANMVTGRRVKVANIDSGVSETRKVKVNTTEESREEENKDVSNQRPEEEAASAGD